ncbi:hypothetical protein PENTCL1PPCAC_28187, partial [Pristionchus entomophagus]
RLAGTMGKKRICVVGAGAAGLPSIRHALLYGFDVVCYESQGTIGGLWRFKPEETDEASVMKSTVINSSKELTAYSDFPPPATAANFMHNTHMCKYLEDYAENFNLTQHIKHYHRVHNVERAPDFAQTGQWIAYLEDLKTNKQWTEVFDGVLVCTGHHTIPYWPKDPWPGQSDFKGQIMHAHSYKDHRGFEDKTVVIVGVGNSGGDIAVELSKIAKQVYVVSRRGTWVFNRVYDYGRPSDCFLNTRATSFFWHNLPPWMVNKAVEGKLNQRFDHEVYGLKPSHGVFGQHPMVNDELPNRIASGTIRIKPVIKKITEHGVEFDDGTKVDDVDAIIVSTGYSFDLPVMEKGKLVPVVENEVELYQLIFPMNVERDTLGVIGFFQPYGSIMAIAEMQARVVLEVIAGRSKLPTMEQRRQSVKDKREQMAKRYAKSRRHTIQVDYIPYMDEMAAMIGCEPPVWHSYLPNDPSMAISSLFAPFASYFYRLRGPHAWPGAREAVLTIEDRIIQDNLLGLIGNLDDGLTNLKGKLGHGGKLIPGLDALKGLLGDYMDQLNIKKRSSPMVDQYPVTEPKREKRFTKDNLLGLIGNLDDGLTNLKGKLGHGGKLIPGLDALKGLLGDYMDQLNIKKRSSPMVDQYPVTEPKREKRFTKDNLLGLIGNLDDGLTNLKGKLGHGGKLIPGLDALKGLLGDYMDQLNIKKRSSPMVDQYP